MTTSEFESAASGPIHTTETRPHRTMVIAGSHRKGHYTSALAKEVAAQLSSRNCAVDLIEVTDIDLPMHNPEDHHDPEGSTDPRVREFAKCVRETDSFVWISPIYNGSYSSGIKLLIDNMNIPLMQGKPVAVMVQGGGRFSGSVIDHLRAIGVNLHADVVNTAVATNRTDFEVTENEISLVSEEIRARIERALNQLVGE